MSDSHLPKRTTRERLRDIKAEASWHWVHAQKARDVGDWSGEKWHRLAAQSYERQALAVTERANGGEL